MTEKFLILYTNIQDKYKSKRISIIIHGKIYISHLEISFLWARNFNGRGFESVLMSENINPSKKRALVCKQQTINKNDKTNIR